MPPFFSIEYVGFVQTVSIKLYVLLPFSLISNFINQSPRALIFMPPAGGGKEKYENHFQ